MTHSFKKRVVRVSTGEEPDWAEAPARPDFARDPNDIRAHFLEH